MLSNDVKTDDDLSGPHPMKEMLESKTIDRLYDCQKMKRHLPYLNEDLLRTRPLTPIRVQSRRRSFLSCYFLPNTPEPDIHRFYDQVRTCESLEFISSPLVPFIHRVQVGSRTHEYLIGLPPGVQLDISSVVGDYERCDTIIESGAGALETTVEDLASIGLPACFLDDCPRVMSNDLDLSVEGVQFEVLVCEQLTSLLADRPISDFIARDGVAKDALIDASLAGILPAFIETAAFIDWCEKVKLPVRVDWWEILISKVLFVPHAHPEPAVGETLEMQDSFGRPTATPVKVIGTPNPFHPRQPHLFPLGLNKLNTMLAELFPDVSFLFHGTPASNYDSFADQGASRLINSSSANDLGGGFYMAEDLALALRYALQVPGARPMVVVYSRPTDADLDGLTTLDVSDDTDEPDVHRSTLGSVAVAAAWPACTRQGMETAPTREIPLDAYNSDWKRVVAASAFMRLDPSAMLWTAPAVEHVAVVRGPHCAGSLSRVKALKELPTPFRVTDHPARVWVAKNVQMCKLLNRRLLCVLMLVPHQTAA